MSAPVFLDVEKNSAGDVPRIGAIRCGLPVTFTPPEVARIWQAAAARNQSKATQAWDAAYTWASARTDRHANDTPHAKGIAGEWAVARLLGLPERADVIVGHGDGGVDLRLPSSGQRVQVKATSADMPFNIPLKRDGGELKAAVGVLVMLSDDLATADVVGYLTLTDWHAWRALDERKNGPYHYVDTARLRPIRTLLVAEAPYQTPVKRAGIYCRHCRDAGALWWWEWRGGRHAWCCATCTPPRHLARVNPLL